MIRSVGSIIVTVIYALVAIRSHLNRVVPFSFELLFLSSHIKTTASTNMDLNFFKELFWVNPCRFAR